MQKFSSGFLFRHRLSLGLTFAVTMAFVGFSFQNCSQNFAFQASEDLNEALASKSYSTATVGDEANFPPLKLFFVVDNSGTMGVNQINLSNAFDRLFAGQNQDNLAPFDTTSFVISTAQYSPNESEAIFPRLPYQPVDYFAALSPVDFAQHRSSTQVNGQIPGDLVGFRVDKRIEPGLETTSFKAAPVTLFKSTNSITPVASASGQKPRGASVDDFSNDFKARIALLNPDLSAIDPISNTGLLDPVVDKESGLCGLARMLKENNGVLRPGDLASVVIVSDEDDADPAGRRCIDQVLKGDSATRYVDGRCESPNTSLSYRRAIANPTPAQCKVFFQTQFKYSLSYRQPRTSVEYSLQSSAYDQLRTEVSFHTFTQTYDMQRTQINYFTSRMVSNPVSTPVSFFTSSPTYEILQTRVDFFKETRSCVIRDGIETNCVYTYTPENRTLEGSHGNSCATFVAGKLPAGSVYTHTNTQYLPRCTAAANLSRTGPCPTNNANVVNCNLNIQPRQTTIAGQPSAGQTCQQFTQNGLGNGAIYGDAANPIQCGTPVVGAQVIGSCSPTDTTRINCRTEYIEATPLTFDGIPTPDCVSFARSKNLSGAVLDKPIEAPVTCSPAEPRRGIAGLCPAVSTGMTNCRTLVSPNRTLRTVNIRTPSPEQCDSQVGNSIGTNINGAFPLRNDPNYPLLCRALSSTPMTGACQSNNPNIENCRTVYTRAPSPIDIGGVPAANQTCSQFLNNNRLPQGAFYGTTPAEHQPVCLGLGAPGSPQQVTGTLNLGQFPSVQFAQGQACDPSVVAHIIQSRGLSVDSNSTPSCTITEVLRTTQPVVFSSPTENVTCASVRPQADAVCADSNGARRNCNPEDQAAGATHESQLTTTTLPGTFTCDSTCAESNACRSGSTIVRDGLVRDFYFACSTTAAAATVTSQFTMQPETQVACNAGSQLRITRGPYTTTETRTTYVAGTRSEQNQASALSDYIVDRFTEILGESKPITSVFVRQPGDSLGNNGSIGTNYLTFASRIGGQSRSVLSGPDVYATALQNLSTEVRKRISRTISFRDMDPDLRMRKVWILRKSAPANVGWGSPIDPSQWSQSGSTLIFRESVTLDYGDQVQIEYW